jgi:hypothetical protein
MFDVVFGVLVNPLADEHFHGFKRCSGFGLGIDATKKAPNVGL